MGVVLLGQSKKEASTTISLTMMAARKPITLGVSKAEMKPKWNGSEFVPRNMLPLAVSYDHRAINGADCGRFFTTLVSMIADIRRILL